MQPSFHLLLVEGDPLLPFLFKLRFLSALRDGIGVLSLEFVNCPMQTPVNQDGEYQLMIALPGGKGL